MTLCVLIWSPQAVRISCKRLHISRKKLLWIRKIELVCKIEDKKYIERNIQNKLQPQPKDYVIIVSVCLSVIRYKLNVLSNRFHIMNVCSTAKHVEYWNRS